MHAALGALLLLAATGHAFAQVVDDFNPHGGRDGVVTLHGSGFTGAGSVAFHGTPAASFTVNSDTEIVATAPASFATGPVSVDASPSLYHFISRTGPVSTVGPVSGGALPLGALVSHSGTPNDGSISRAGGQTFYFENLPLSSNTWLYWGAAAGGVRLSMNGNDFNSPPGEVMTFSETQSDLAAGKLVYTGVSALSLMAPWPPGASLCTRFTLRFQPYNGSPRPRLMAAAGAGLPAPIGAVAAIAPGHSFGVNLLFEAAYTSQACTAWTPALLLYDAAPTNPTLSAWSSFTGGFFYENTAPEIGSIADQTVPEGGSTGDIGFSLGDAETGDVGISLSVASDNESLVPLANIALDGSGAARTISATAVAGQSGSALITLTATDSAGASSSRSFTLSTNNAPTISPIGDVLVQYNQGSGAIAFTIGDDETPADDLIVTAVSSNTTLVPNANIALGGSGRNRTISVQPFLSQTGSTTITISVADGDSGVATRSFVFRVNAPPVLVQNSPGQAQQGGGITIGNTLLRATDAESPATAIRFTLNPDGTGTVPYAGELRLDGTVLGDLDSFTQADIDAGRITYQNDDSCTAFDAFTFNVDDGEGGMTPLPPLPASFKFNIGIELRNEPPTATDGALSVGMGASVNGQLLGSDNDCLDTDELTYAIVPASGPAKGSIAALDPVSGAFTYTASPGQTGTDGFDFSVSDGTHSATAHVTIEIQNQPPHAEDMSVTTLQEVAVNGTVVATDIDLPPQTLTFAIATNGAKGSATIDAASGQFLYTPGAGRIGADSFTVVASDGTATSAPATVSVQIRPRMDAGVIVTVSKSNGGSPAAVIVVAPATGDQAIVSSGDQLTGPHGVAADAAGNIYVSDENNGLLHIAADTGTQTVLDGDVGLPLGVRLDPAGHLLYAEGFNGLSVRNTDGSVIARYSGGALEFVSDAGVGQDGFLYVSDAGSMAGGSNKIVRIDPATAAQQVVVASGLALPVSLIVRADGKLVVGDGIPEFGQSSSLLLIDPTDATVTSISDPLFAGISGLDSTESGEIYAANMAGRNVLQVSTSGDPQVVISQDGMLEELFGLGVVKRYDVTITLHNPAAPVHDGNPHPATATTTPPGLENFVAITYTPQAGGTPVACAPLAANCGPVDAGTYAVSAQIVGTPNYSGSATGTLTIGKATGTVAWGSLSFVYDGSAPTPSAHISEAPATSCVVSGTVGPDVGTYPVHAQCSGSNYDASADAEAQVTPQAITITLSDLAQTYDGSPKPVTATTAPTPDVPLTISYDGSSTPPSAAGSYAVVATASGANYSGSANATLVIGKATGTVTWGSLSFVYDGSAPTPSAHISQEPATSCVVSGTVGPDVGAYPIHAQCSGSNYDASADAEAQVTPQAITITLSDLTQTYDGAPKPVTATTAPTPDVPLTISYDGSSTPPSAVGSYAVVATASGANHSGSASATLVIVEAEAIDLSVAIAGKRGYVQLNKLRTYTIVVGNNGNTAINAATIANTLSPALDADTARWACFPIGSSTCTPTGSGDLHDTIDMPVNGGLVYLLTATVRGDPADPTDTVVNTVIVEAVGDSNNANGSDTETARAVLLRDSFEVAGDGAQWPDHAPVVIELGGLADAGMLPLDIAAAALIPNQVTSIAQSSDATFRIEAIRVGGTTWLRLLGSANRSSPWAALEGSSVLLGLGHGAQGTVLLLAGTTIDLQLDLDDRGPFVLERHVD